MSNPGSSTDRRPVKWALATIGTMFVVWLGLHFVGEQRYYNTAWWQSWRPIALTSAPQTARPVEVRDQWRNALTVVQTEKGLYFLSGTRFVPESGASVVVQANVHWELYLCAADGRRCMTIHSFCAGAVWPNVKRDANGHAEGCFAPYLGKRSTEDLEKPPAPSVPPRGGPGKQFKGPPPPRGMSHPREWAALMGLPGQAQRTAP